MSKATKIEPQKCPKCGSEAIVKNPRPRYFFVTCSKNSAMLIGHNVTGHVMLTRSKAVEEWNKLT